MIKDPASSLEILLRFWKFYDWRIADINLDGDTPTRCLILPMEINAIDVSPNGGLPFMRMLISKTFDMSHKDGFIRVLSPSLPRHTWDKLVAEGKLMRQEDDKMRLPTIGGIRPLLWAATYNAELGSSLDKVYGLKLSKDQKFDDLR